MSTTDVDDVATDADLANWTGGPATLQGLLPEDWFEEGADRKTAKLARQVTLDRILVALKSRRPPILESDLVDPAELKMAVVFGALEMVYNGAVEHEDSPNQAKAKAFGRKFEAELGALQPSVLAGASASSLSVRISRG